MRAPGLHFLFANLRLTLWQSECSGILEIVVHGLLIGRLARHFFLMYLQLVQNSLGSSLSPLLLWTANASTT